MSTQSPVPELGASESTQRSVSPRKLETSSLQSQVAAPAPEAAPTMSFRAQSSVQPEGTWRNDIEADLQKAVAEVDRAELERLVEEIDQRRSGLAESSEDVALLGLAVRARGELLLLFPDARADSCGRMRQEYEAWRQRADERVQTSWEGLRIRDLIRNVCPED
jgi:hypothetical protein